MEISEHNTFVNRVRIYTRSAILYDYLLPVLACWLYITNSQGYFIVASVGVCTIFIMSELGCFASGLPYRALLCAAIVAASSMYFNNFLLGVCVAKVIIAACNIVLTVCLMIIRNVRNSVPILLFASGVLAYMGGDDFGQWLCASTALVYMVISFLGKGDKATPIAIVLLIISAAVYALIQHPTHLFALRVSFAGFIDLIVMAILGMHTVYAVVRFNLSLQTYLYDKTL